MKVRGYKITTVCLICLVLALAWCCATGIRQVLQAKFVAFQAADLRTEIELANGGWNVGRESVLYTLNFYLGCYDSRTNALAHSPFFEFLKVERQYLVRDAIAYLRKTGTNDWGDDPYRWLEKENAR